MKCTKLHKKCVAEVAELYLQQVSAVIAEVVCKK